MLRAGDQRAVCHALVAGWVRDAVEESRGGTAGFARGLGVDGSLARRWLLGERGIPLGTLLAASPVIAAPVLRRALDRIDGTPWRDEGSVVYEAIRVAAGAVEVASKVERMSLEQMPPEERSRLATWLRELAARLYRLANRVEGGR